MGRDLAQPSPPPDLGNFSEVRLGALLEMCNNALVELENLGGGSSAPLSAYLSDLRQRVSSELAARGTTEPLERERGA